MDYQMLTLTSSSKSGGKLDTGQRFECKFLRYYYKVISFLRHQEMGSLGEEMVLDIKRPLAR